MPSLSGQAKNILKTTSLSKEGTFREDKAGENSFIQKATSLASLTFSGSPTANWGSGSPTSLRGPGSPTGSPQTIGSLLLSGVSQNTGSLSARGQDVGQPARTERRRRYGDVESSKTLGDLVDGAVESAMDTGEQSWLVKSCMEQPVCQRVCYPAEYATRRARTKKKEDSAGGTGGERQESQVKNASFGFPDFASAGFTLVDNEEAPWVDPLVPGRLGLHFATHRKTSVQRLCYIVEKAKLPASTKPQDVTVLVRALKRCDHVNILQVDEVFEDEGHIYMMFEPYPCCTLFSLLESHTWSQEQIVNICRECCAAAAYCSASGLRHVGWTLCHILLPAGAAKGEDPGFAKVFGFGLMGTVLVDTHDHLLWGPEALEKYRQQNGVLGNFLQRLEGAQTICCDCWSLGAIIYSLIARRPPAALEEDILQKRWTFTLAIDDMDPEAKTLVEGFLHSNPDRRLRPERALHHEWVRRRWRPMPGGEQVMMKMHDFVNMPLVKKLFARFLTFYLDPEHVLQIARSFSKLDMVGNGVIMLRELEIAARGAGLPEHAAQAVHAWFARDGNEHISLRAFAECYAEEIIDGKALRHSFESLDDDGSQQISADELHNALVGYNDSLTMEDVIEHIASVELGLGDGETAQDHSLDYAEFVRLFPGRAKRTKAMEDRVTTSRSSGGELSQRFRSQQPELEAWVGGLESLIETIKTLGMQTIQRGEQASEAAFELRKHFAHAEHGLKCPPGPENDLTKAQQRGLSIKSQRKVAAKVSGNMYGFDTFVQDIALQDQWNSMITMEVKMLKSATAGGRGKLAGQSEQLKAHDAAEGVSRKVGDAVARTRGQLEEYLSFAETFESPEPCLGEVTFSGRALPPRCGDVDEEDLLMQAGENDGGALRSPIARFLRDVTARVTSRFSSR